MTLKLRELKSVGAHYNDKRRGRRLNSRVPVRLEWDSVSGQRRSIEAVTRTVNPYGCMIVLSDTLELEHRLALTNLGTFVGAICFLVGGLLLLPERTAPAEAMSTSRAGSSSE